MISYSLLQAERQLGRVALIIGSDRTSIINITIACFVIRANKYCNNYNITVKPCWENLLENVLL
jgi:hypothetical protein